MLYQPQNSEKNIAKKTKRCVYCGHNFNVKNNIIDKWSTEQITP